MCALEVYGLETRLTGALAISSSTGRAFQGNGIIRLEEGRYRAYGQNLTILRGDMIFSRRLDNPNVNLEAVRNGLPEDIVVGVRANGPVRSPTIAVFSSPTMSEQARLHYLLTGQAPGEGSQDSNAMMAQAAIGLGAAAGENVLQNYAERLGIYDFQVGTAENEGSTEVQVSGYINPRLYLRYGKGVFDKLNSVTMRYKLRQNLYLEAVSSASNALDILWVHRLRNRRDQVPDNDK